MKTYGKSRAPNHKRRKKSNPKHFKFDSYFFILIFIGTTLALTSLRSKKRKEFQKVEALYSLELLVQ